MNKISVFDIIKNLDTLDFTNDLKVWGEYKDLDGIGYRVNLCPVDYWKNNVLLEYGERMFLYYGTQPYNSFKNVFKNWIDKNQKNIDILTSAFFRNYDPLENYDKYSDIELTKDGAEITDMVKGTTNTKTESGSEKDTQTFTGSEKDSLTMTGTETNTNGVVPFDKTTFKSTEKTDTTFNNRKNENEHTFTNRKNEVERTFTGRTTTDALTGTDSSTLSFNDRKDKTVEHTHGQIGVTANYQLIEGEVGVRLESLTDRILNAFFNEYTCYIYCE